MDKDIEILVIFDTVLGLGRYGWKHRFPTGTTRHTQVAPACAYHVFRSGKPSSNKLFLTAESTTFKHTCCISQCTADPQNMWYSNMRPSNILQKSLKSHWNTDIHSRSHGQHLNLEYTFLNKHTVSTLRKAVKRPKPSKTPRPEKQKGKSGNQKWKNTTWTNGVTFCSLRFWSLSLMCCCHGWVLWIHIHSLIEESAVDT